MLAGEPRAPDHDQYKQISMMNQVTELKEEHLPRLFVLFLKAQSKTKAKNAKKNKNIKLPMPTIKEQT